MKKELLLGLATMLTLGLSSCAPTNKASKDYWFSSYSKVTSQDEEGKYHTVWTMVARDQIDGVLNGRLNLNGYYDSVKLTINDVAQETREPIAVFNVAFTFHPKKGDTIKIEAYNNFSIDYSGKTTEFSFSAFALNITNDAMYSIEDIK